MEIRALKQEDISALAEVVWQNYRSEQYRQSALVDLNEAFSAGPYTPTYFVADDAGVPVGFAGCMQSWMDNDVYEVFWVAVAPGRQKQGIGKKLVAAAIAFAIERHGRLIILTAPAPDYYAANFGFKLLERLPGRTDALMSLSLE